MATSEYILVHSVLPGLMNHDTKQNNDEVPQGGFTNASERGKRAQFILKHWSASPCSVSCPALHPSFLSTWYSTAMQSEVTTTNLKRKALDA
eukprot:scaffold155699_cov36-Prasinocladus_malaysianus.AAC.1